MFSDSAFGIFRLSKLLPPPPYGSPSFTGRFYYPCLVTVGFLSLSFSLSLKNCLNANFTLSIDIMSAILFYGRIRFPPKKTIL